MANKKTKQNNIRIPHALTKVLLMRFQLKGYSLSTTDTYNRFLINVLSCTLILSFCQPFSFANDKKDENYKV